MITANKGEQDVHARIEEALKRGESALAQAGIEDAQGEAVCLFCFAAGISKSELLLRQSKALSPRQGRSAFGEDVYRKYDSLIARRFKRIPLQHILGSVNFFGFDFKVDERALIPRFETELLVEKTLEKIEAIQNENCKESINVLDLGTGTGVIGITIKKTIPDVECTLSDVSSDALELAADNSKSLKADVHIVQSDLFEKFSDEKFDIIVSNPPYIRRADIDNLQTEVCEFDPHLALDGGEDGLEFYRNIANEAQNYLKHSGYLICEIGADQGRDVVKIFKEAGAVDACIIKDFTDKDRILETRFDN